MATARASAAVYAARACNSPSSCSPRAARRLIRCWASRSAPTPTSPNRSACASCLRASTRDGSAVETSAKEFELLRYLVAHRGEVVSREVVLSEVWGHAREIATRTVDNFVVRLRKKIEIDPAEPRYLITVHGSGYKLVEQ